MKVYTEHERIKEYLLAHPIDGVHILDQKEGAHFLLTGRYQKDDYHQNLRGIIIPWTGHNRIDLEAMRQENLMLFVTPTRSRYVAEKAVMLTLALMGKVMHYHDHLKEGNWAERNAATRVPWETIQDKTIGLYGYGRIGKIIHTMLKGFGCDFVTIDRGKEYPSDISIVKNVTNLVQMCDVIIIAAPLNETTEGMFDKRILSRMKNKYLINVGRGKIVDEEGLYLALKDNTLKGFASDVWYNYPKDKEMCYPSSYPLHELDNVVLSNHSGGYTMNTNDEVNKDIIKTLKKLNEENYEDQLDLENIL